MIPNKVRYFDAQFCGIRINYAGVESRLTPLPYGLCLLLGKNGTGKSSLINALKHFQSGINSEFPALAMTYQLPSSDSYLEYLETVEFHKNNDEYHRLKSPENGHIFALDRELFNLPIIEVLLSGLEMCWTMQPIRIFERDLDAIQILQLFDFTDKEVDAFISRRARANDLAGERSDYFIEEFSVSMNSHYEEYFPEFFLSLLRRSTIWTSGHWTFHFPIEPIRSDVWLEDAEHRTLVTDALREIFSNGLFELVVDSHHGRVGHGIQFTCQTADCEKVKKFFLRRDQLWREYINRVEAYGQFDYTLVFPYDLLNSHQTGLCTTGTTPIGELALSTGRPIHEFFTCKEIQPQADAEAIQALLEEKINWRLSVELDDPELDSRRNLKVTGVGDGFSDVQECVDHAARILRDCDIGIRELRVSYSSSSDEFVFLQSGMANHGLPTHLFLQFRGSENGEWRSIKAASDGQRAAIHAVFQILLQMSRQSTGAGFNVVVADEFDRHLHPSTADHLLAQLHKAARSNQSTLLISTHSIPLLKSKHLRECVRVFSEKDALDRIELTTKPGHQLSYLAESLGTSTLQARSLYDLHVVVEGETDVAILEYILDDPRFDRTRIEFISLDGIKNLKRDWMRSLYYLTSPILVVYDRQSTEFETIWKSITENPTDYREQVGLMNLRQACRERRDTGFLPGDTELASLIDLASEVLSSRRYPDFVEQTRRIRFFGLDEDDIVDYLPIDYFWKSNRGGKGVDRGISSWKQAKAVAGFRKGAAFKDSVGLTIEKVKRVLVAMQKESRSIESPRLAELLNEVIETLAPGSSRAAD